MQITIPLIPVLLIWLAVKAIKSSSRKEYINSFGSDIKYPAIKSVSELENGVLIVYDATNGSMNVGDYFVYEKSKKEVEVYQVLELLSIP